MAINQPRQIVGYPWDVQEVHCNDDKISIRHTIQSHFDITQFKSFDTNILLVLIEYNVLFASSNVIAQLILFNSRNFMYHNTSYTKFPTCC